MKRIYYAAAEGLQEVKEVRMGTQKIWPHVPKVLYIEIARTERQDEVLDVMLANSMNSTPIACRETLTIGDLEFKDTHSDARTFKLDVSKKLIFTPPQRLDIKENEEVKLIHTVYSNAWLLISTDKSDKYGDGVICAHYVCGHIVEPETPTGRLFFNKAWEEGWEINIYKSDGSFVGKVTEKGASYELTSGLYLFKGNVPYGNDFAVLLQSGIEFGVVSTVTKIEKI